MKIDLNREGAHKEKVGLIKELCQDLRDGRSAGGEMQEWVMNGMLSQEHNNWTIKNIAGLIDTKLDKYFLILLIFLVS